MEDRGPQTGGRRLIVPYGTLSLSNPDVMEFGVRFEGMNSFDDFLYGPYFVLEGLE